jgi:hypothetical protein
MWAMAHHCSKCGRPRHSRRPCRMCARLAGRPLAEVRCHHCGAPAPSSATPGARCPKCRTKRRPGDRARRQAAAERRFPREIRDSVLDRLGSGVPLREVCEELGVTVPQVFGWRVYDETWAAALDAALTAGRDETLAHGTLHTYGHHGCRCPDCRRRKAETR